MGRRNLFGFAALFLALLLAQSAAQETSASSSSADETKVNGVLQLVSTDAVTGCESGCKKGLAAAFGVEEIAIVCLCPATASDSRRRLSGGRPRSSVFGFQVGRNLRSLAGVENAAFFVRIPGGLTGGVKALELFKSAFALVAGAFGVSEEELVFSTLTVTPPYSAENGLLSTVSETADASDIAIVRGSDANLAGGGKQMALLLALLVLVGGTACCGFCVAFGCSWSKGRSFKGVKSGKMAYSWANTRKKASKETVVSSHVGGAREVNAPLSMDSPCGSPAVLTPVQESAEEATTSLTNPFRRTKESSGEISQASSRASGALPSYSTSTGASESALGREGEAGSGAGATASRPASSSSGENPPTGSEVNNSVSKDSRGGVPPGSGTSTMVFARTPGGKSDVESRGTNPLYKSVAPFSRNGNGGAAATAPSSGKTGKVMDTPTRSRFGGILGNVTPARLRRLAGRAMSSRSPARSGTSHQRSSSGGSGKSGKSGRHRRDRSFPGKYDQKNSSEMDHQRPPADPVYTFMIKTIAGKGFKFMTTTEIAFCAMRMYSHFRRTEGNFKRLAVMKQAENVPSVYEIIWLCDTAGNQLSGGQSRFFSTSRGTDAEQQKSLLACLLALQWNGTYSTRRALETALTPTNIADVPSEEDVFWDNFKDSTDALSGDDAIVVLARVVLLVGNSNREPAQGGDLAAGRSSEIGMDPEPSPAKSVLDSVAMVSVDHVDIMRALSGAHMREIGIAIKAARPVWQEAHVQLVSVHLIVSFLEDAAGNISPGGRKPDALSSLDWIVSLSPKELDHFLVEKLEARRSVVELDLQPSGLVIKHDNEGQVERVEPAVLEKKSSQSSGRIGVRSTSRSGRSHRRSLSGGNNTLPVEPVVITTINRRQQLANDSVGGGPSSEHSTTNTSSKSLAGTASGSRLRTIAQVRASSSIGSTSNPSPAQASRVSRVTRTSSTEPLQRSGGGTNDDDDDDAAAAEADPLLMEGQGLWGTSDRPSKGSEGGGSEGFAGVSIAGESVQSGLSNIDASDSECEKSEASSVVTRVYAPSQMDDSNHEPMGRVNRFTSWTNTDADGQDTQMQGVNSSPGGLPSPLNKVPMSQISIAGSRFDRSPSNEPQQVGRFSGLLRARAQSPSSASVAASRFEEQLPTLEADVAGDAAGGLSVFARRGSRNLPRMEAATPTSAAGSRFADSPSSYADSRLPGSPTAGGGPGANARPSTADSKVSSIRSDSFFRETRSTSRSVVSSSAAAMSSASETSWDEEDVQNMGERWLSDRAFNQKYSSEVRKT